VGRLVREIAGLLMSLIKSASLFHAELGRATTFFFVLILSAAKDLTETNGIPLRSPAGRNGEKVLERQE